MASEKFQIERKCEICGVRCQTRVHNLSFNLVWGFS